MLKCCILDKNCIAGHARQGVLGGINLAFYAVNLGEAASDLLPRDVLAEIYVLAAVLMKAVLPNTPKLLNVIIKEI